MGNFLIKRWSGLFTRAALGPMSTFPEIVGHEDIKQIFSNAMCSKRPVHLLLIGSPGSAKTTFLTQIMRNRKDSYFVVGSNTTKAGLVNQLFQIKPKFLLIDELEKMNVSDQTALLHLMETGIISETKINKTRQTELSSWVFATANTCVRIIPPLLSRLVILEVPSYNIEEFLKIAVNRLARENVGKDIARIIAQKVWYDLGSRDVRDVIKVARLSNSVEEIPFVIRMLNRKYNVDGGNNN